MVIDMKLFRQLTTFIFVFTLGAFSFTSCFLQVKAQLTNSGSNISQRVRIRFNPPPPPPKGTGAPGSRGSGGSQGPCQIGNSQIQIDPLIALVYQKTVDEANSKTDVWGQTTLKQPSFWFYISYLPPAQAEFILQNKEGEDLYRQSFKLSGTPGIVQFRLPSEVAIQKGQLYHWYLKIKCSPQGSTDDFADGWVQQVELDAAIEKQLNPSAPLNNAAIYAENGIWYDALTVLAELRRDRPNDNAISTAWNDLLQSVDLNNIAQKPIISCCTSANSRSEN